MRWRAVPMKSSLTAFCRRMSSAMPGTTEKASLFGCSATVTSVASVNAPAGTVTVTPSTLVNFVSTPTGATKPRPSGVTNGVRRTTAAMLPAGLTTCRSMVSAMVTRSEGSVPPPTITSNEPSTRTSAW